MTNSTTKRVTMSAVFLMATLLFSVDSAQAQSHMLQVTIPFSFYSGDTLLPAGNYEAAPFVNNVVRLHNLATRVSTLFSTSQLSSKGVGQIVPPKLIFNKYGDNHFLAEMWWGQGTGCMPIASKRETELAKNFDRIRIEAKAQR